MAPPTFTRFLFWRLAQFAATVWCASFLIFLIIQLTPGNLAEIHALAPTTVSRWHLDEPVWRQYFLWLAGCLRGDFGISLTSGLPVGALLWQHAGTTLSLAGGSILLSLLLALPIGILVGLRPESSRMHVLLTGVYCLSSVPVFVVGYIVLAIVFGVFQFYPLDPPAGGWTFWPFVSYYLLPMLVLAVGNGTIGEFVRALSLEVRKINASLFVKAARARGVPLARHFIRPIIIPFTSVVISRIALLLGGAVVVERIFNRHGVGWLTWEATLNRDFYLIMAVTLVSACLVRFLMFLQELAAWVIEPRRWGRR